MTSALCPGVAPAAPGRVPTRGARHAGRAAALLAGGSAAAHLALLFAPGHGVAMLVPIAAMAVACAGCAVRAWRCQARGDLLALMFMSLGMALLHAALVLGIPGQAGMHAMHEGGAPAAAQPAGAATAAGAGAVTAGDAGASTMLAVIVLELAVAWAAGLAVRLQGAGSLPQAPRFAAARPGAAAQPAAVPPAAAHPAAGQPRALQLPVSSVRRTTSATTSSAEPLRS